MLNYFEFYGLPVGFYPDAQVLRAAYIRLSKENHPDYHRLSTENAQDVALEQSVFNNQAYNTLKNFESRVAYVLQLEGVAEENISLPPDFLMQMMEWNEALEEIESGSKNIADTAEKIQNLANELKNSRLAAEQALRPVLESYVFGASSPEILKKIKIFEKKLLFFLRGFKRLSTFASANDQ